MHRLGQHFAHIFLLIFYFFYAKPTKLKIRIVFLKFCVGIS